MRNGSRISTALPLGARDETGESWRQKKEKWLIVMGIVLHAVYMMSIFDIYFKSPIVHGMDPVTPRIDPPAKRLVLFIADGLRADKFFELESDGRPRAPFFKKHNPEERALGCFTCTASYRIKAWTCGNNCWLL